MEKQIFIKEGEVVGGPAYNKEIFFY